MVWRCAVMLAPVVNIFAQLVEHVFDRIFERLTFGGKTTSIKNNRMHPTFDERESMRIKGFCKVLSQTSSVSDC